MEMALIGNKRIVVLTLWVTVMAPVAPAAVAEPPESAAAKATRDIGRVVPIDRWSPIDYSCSLLTASAAYARECAGEPNTRNGFLTIDHTTEIDPARCYRRVTGPFGTSGTFKFITNDPSFHQVGFPYLECLDGNLEIEAKADLDEIYFPRLNFIRGEVMLDFRDMLEYVDLPSLEQIQTLSIRFRDMNMDLNGLNKTTTITTLALYNAVATTDTLLNGLNGITELTTLNIEGGSILNYDENNGDADDGGFLEKLTLLKGNLSMKTDNMNHLYGIGNINEVQGNVTLSHAGNAPALLTNLEGIDLITNIAGKLSVRDVDSLTSLDGLSQIIVGALEVTDNANLDDVSALVNLQVSASGSVTFENNPSIDCVQLNNFIATLAGSVTVNSPDC